MITEAFMSDDSAEPGWFICDGRLLAIADQPELFAAFGARYGGDGVATFALPDVPPAGDLRLRVKVI